MFENPRFRSCLINISCSQFLLSTATDNYWVSEAVFLSVAQKWAWDNQITENIISCFKKLSRTSLSSTKQQKWSKQNIEIGSNNEA